MLILGDGNESRRFPFVNWLIIISCSLITLMVFGGMDAEIVIRQYGCIPARFLAHQDWAQLFTLLSSTFLHAGFLHLIGNMWYLHIFGDNIEDHFGHFNYAMFYLTCGILAALAQLAAEPSSMIPCVSASGAIAGVLGAYLVLYPDAKIKMWWGDDSIFFAFRTYEIPAWAAIGSWFALQYVCMNMHIPGIGWHAHIFGFITGILVVGIYKMCGEKCSDNNSINHHGGNNQMQSSLAHHESEARTFTKPLLAIALSGALAACGTFYVIHRANSKVEPPTAQPIAAQTAKPVHSTANTHDVQSTKNKTRTGQKSRHKRTADTHRTSHRRSALVS